MAMVIFTEVWSGQKIGTVDFSCSQFMGGVGFVGEMRLALNLSRDNILSTVANSRCKSSITIVSTMIGFNNDLWTNS